MTHSGTQVSFAVGDDKVSYQVFAVLALTHNLSDLEERITTLASKEFDGELFARRCRCEDKYVLWFAIKEDEHLKDFARKATFLSVGYARQNGCLRLSISEVWSSYTSLYWEIINVLLEAEEESGADVETDHEEEA